MNFKQLPFWETKEWIEAKTFILKTDKLLSRLEYLKNVGYKNYSEKKYQKYLEVMTKKTEEGGIKY